MRLQGKAALVTGAGSGNGAAIAAGFAAEGALVVFADINLENAEAKAADAGGQSVGVELDVGSAQSVDQCVKQVLNRFGRIDILVNNAGIITRLPFLEVPEQDWDKVMRVNAKGVFLCSQAVARHMVAQGGGVIVNISSISAFVALPNTTHYGASKGAVSMLTRHMALDLAGYHIRVNAIAPGVIKTNMTKDRLSNPEQVKRSLQNTPLGRLGEPEDLVGAAIYLASDESRFVTGSTIAVDGGWMIQ